MMIRMLLLTVFVLSIGLTGCASKETSEATGSEVTAATSSGHAAGCECKECKEKNMAQCSCKECAQSKDPKANCSCGKDGASCHHDGADHHHADKAVPSPAPAKPKAKKKK